MLLSICILMKGDPRSLHRIAEATQGMADEIVAVYDDVLDAAVKGVANQCGARAIPHRWQKDFSAARNAGLRAARGDWVFWIDNDETLISPDVAMFRKLLEAPDVWGYYVTIQDEQATSTITPSTHVRLYRRREDIRYFGRIHEHFDGTPETLAAKFSMKVASSPVRLTHTGYRAEIRQEKLKRNIELLELELADRPGQFYFLVELGRSLLLDGQSRGHAVMAEAAQVLRPVLHQSKSPTPLAAAFLEYALSHAPVDFPMKRAVAAETAARWFPSTPPLIWLIARWHYEQARVAEAAQLLQQILEMGEKKDYYSPVSFDRRIFGDETRLNYGVCCAKLGQTKKATEQFNLIKAGSPFYQMARQNIQRLNSK